MAVGSGYNARYDSLDAWRGVACLMVVIHHTGYYALGWSETNGTSVEAWVRWLVMGAFRRMELGVPLFFVISGYCIAASVDSHRRRGASAWVFLGRRFRRIYPPYWASLLAFVATIWSLDRLGWSWLHHGPYSLELKSPGMLDRAQWLGNLTLTETWRSKVWHGSWTEVYTRVAWSLCFEEQFYFVCFLALLVARRWLYGALGWATAVIVAWHVFAYDSGWLWHYEGTFLERWHEFAVGLLVYWRLVAAPTRQAKTIVDLMLVALFVVGLMTVYVSTWLAAAFGLALIALRRFDDGAERLAVLEPLRACGRRCYSIYLIHLLVCTIGNELLCRTGIFGFWGKALVMTPIVATVAVATGWAFFAVVESRFLNPPADRKPHARPLAGERATSVTASP